MIDTMLAADIAHRAKEIIELYRPEGRLVYKPLLVKPKHRKPLSYRRAVEFRGRYLRRMFGPAKVRAERRAWLVARYGNALFMQKFGRIPRPKVTNGSD